MFRAFSVGLAVTATALCAWAAYDLLRPAPQPVLVIAPIEHDLGTVSVGDRTVAFAIANPSDRPRRLLGATEG
jgi:hypothetical protein